MLETPGAILSGETPETGDHDDEGPLDDEGPFGEGVLARAFEEGVLARALAPAFGIEDPPWEPGFGASNPKPFETSPGADCMGLAFVAEGDENAVEAVSETGVFEATESPFIDGEDLKTSVFDLEGETGTAVLDGLQPGHGAPTAKSDVGAGVGTLLGAALAPCLSATDGRRTSAALGAEPPLLCLCESLFVSSTLDVDELIVWLTLLATA